MKGFRRGELNQDMNVPKASKTLLTYLCGAAFEWHLGDKENDVVATVECFSPMIGMVLKTC